MCDQQEKESQKTEGQDQFLPFYPRRKEKKVEKEEIGDVSCG